MNVLTPLIKAIVIKLALIFALPALNAATLVEEITIPNDAYGVVVIEKPEAGALPFLFGLKGKGRYVTRNKEGELCEIAPVPLIAGGFSGRGIERYTEETIRIAIYDPQISMRLMEGKKIVSGHYTRNPSQTENDVDIEVLTGLDRAEGFVLHPRRRWLSWFNSDSRELSCVILDENAGATR